MREHLLKGFYPNDNGTNKIVLNDKEIFGWWVEGDIVTDYCTGQKFIHPYGDSANESDKVNEEGCLKFFSFEILPETVCEYTGLADKNGKKIFEGHTCTDGQNLYEIVFDRYQFAVKVIKTQLSLMQKGDIFPLWQFDNCERNGFRKLEIIGDIYNTTEGI